MCVGDIDNLGNLLIFLSIPNLSILENFMEKIAVIDLSEILDGLENKWVVLSKDNKKILAVAEEYEQLGEKTKQGTVLKVPDPNYSYSPTVFIL